MLVMSALEFRSGLLAKTGRAPPLEDQHLGWHSLCNRQKRRQLPKHAPSRERCYHKHHQPRASRRNPAIFANEKAPQATFAGWPASIGRRSVKFLCHWMLFALHLLLAIAVASDSFAPAHQFHGRARKLTRSGASVQNVVTEFAGAASHEDFYLFGCALAERFRLWSARPSMQHYLGASAWFEHKRKLKNVAAAG